MNTLVEHGQWRAVEMHMTPDKIEWLWHGMTKYRTLFSDFTRGDIQNFYNLISLRDSFWIEVLDQNDKIIGVIYWTSMSQVIDADVHLIFFDRKPAEKLVLCKKVATWFFENNPQCNRMTATLPIIYSASVRLAQRIGFKREGRKRQSIMMRGKMEDELILGLLNKEII